MSSQQVVGVLLAVLVLPASVYGYQRLTSLPRYSDRRLRRGVWCSIGSAAVLAGYVLVVEGRPLASAGVGFDPAQVAGAAMLGFLLAAIGTLITGAVAQLLGRTLADEVDVLLHLQPTRWKLLVAVVAGVTEEFLYRGYLIERLLELGTPQLAAGLVSTVTFVVMHAPGRDVRKVVATLTLPALGFTAAYLLTRNAVGLAVAHAAYNATLFLALDGDHESLAEQVAGVDLDPRVAERLPDVEAA